MFKKLESLREFSCSQIINCIKNSLQDQNHNQIEYTETSASKALFDIFSILEHSNAEDFKNIRISLVGNWCELFESYLDLAIYLPIEIMFAIPKDSQINMDKLSLALDLGAKVFVGNTINLALYKSNYLIINEHKEIVTKNINDEDFKLTAQKTKDMLLLPSSISANFEINTLPYADKNIFYKNLQAIL